MMMAMIGDDEDVEECKRGQCVFDYDDDNNDYDDELMMMMAMMTSVNEGSV